jgi:hypothetical protein
MVISTSSSSVERTGVCMENHLGYKNGVAEVLAMETLSAIPIEDKVGMSMAMVSRKGIWSIRMANGLIVISDGEEH